MTRRRVAVFSKHGQSTGDQKSGAYRSWRKMLQRCTSPNAINWHNYGGRGIRVCDRWRASFADFLSDMGEQPSTVHSLERTDNDRGYEPGNVVWATKTDQSRNRRNTRLLEIDGVAAPMVVWAEAAGVNECTIHSRLDQGKSDSEAVFMPSRYSTSPKPRFRPDAIEIAREWARKKKAANDNNGGGGPSDAA